jgi:hypothetical protein
MHKRFIQVWALGLVLLSAACGRDDDDGGRDDRFGRDRFARDDDRRADDDDDDSDNGGSLAPSFPPADGDAGPGDPGSDDDGAPAPSGDDDGPPAPDADDDEDDLPQPPALETPPPEDECTGIPAGGWCDFDVLTTCEDGRRIDRQCDTICGAVDGQLACLSETAMVIETFTPTFVCQGASGPIAMVMGGGEIIAADESQTQFYGSYEYLSDGIRFDLPGHLEGDTTAELVEAMMILGFALSDDVWCNAYGYDALESFDASYDCGAVDSIGGYGIVSEAFALSKPGHVVLYSTVDTEWGTSTYEYQGVYRVQGDQIVMATIQDDTTIEYEATRYADGIQLANGAWCGAQ